MQKTTQVAISRTPGALKDNVHIGTDHYRTNTFTAIETNLTKIGITFGHYQTYFPGHYFLCPKEEEEEERKEGTEKYRSPKGKKLWDLVKLRKN